LHVRYAHILSVVTPLQCFLVLVFPHVKAAQRKTKRKKKKTDFKGMLLVNAKQNRVHLRQRGKHYFYEVGFIQALSLRLKPQIQRKGFQKQVYKALRNVGLKKRYSSLYPERERF